MFNEEKPRSALIVDSDYKFLEQLREETMVLLHEALR